MDLLERLDPAYKTPAIEVRDFSGLSLKSDSPNQPAGVWQVLSNWDLYVPGSIRKVLPFLQFGTATANKILQFCSYWAEPNDPNGPTLRVIGLGDDYHLYDLTTGVSLVDVSSFFSGVPVTVPFMEVLPIYFVPFNPVSWFPTTAFALHDFVLKYDTTDGNLYVFAVTTAGTSGAHEPVWTHGTPVTDGSVVWTSQGIPNSNRFQENAIIITMPGGQVVMIIEYRYDPTNNGETRKFFAQQVGIPNPTTPFEIGGLTLTPNLNGYIPTAGRVLAYTFYDPNTLHESSPAPFAGKTKITEVDNSNTIATIPGSILPPLFVAPSQTITESYQSYYVSLPVTQAQAALNLGYESMYVYATKDGGSIFYRLTEIFDDSGNLISNSDGSVSIARVLALSTAKSWTDYTPLPTPQSMEPSVRFYEGGGPINLVPDPTNFGPSSWVVKAGSALIIVPGDAPDGNAAVEQIGTGSGQPTQILQSITVPVQNGKNYFFQGYLDATAANSGTFEWRIVSGDGTVVYLTVPQTNGIAGIVTGTFLKPADSHSQIRVQIRSVSGNINSGEPVIWADPLMVLGTVAPSVLPFYPTPDSSLTIPAPATLSQGPPPSKALSLAIFQGALFVLEYGTFRAWYSNVGDFQSFTNDSFAVPDSSTAGEPVLELVKGFDRIIIGKLTNISQIAGSDQTNFEPAPIDPQHGVMAARSSISDGSALIVFLNVGIAIVGLAMAVPRPDTVALGFRPEHLIGDIIKPYTDNINPNTLRSVSAFEPCPAIDNTRNIYLYANYQAAGNANYSDNMLMGTLTHKGPSIWSVLNGLPAGAITIREVQLYHPTSGQLISGVLMSGSDKKMYLLFGGTENGTLQAIGTTWPLPDLSQLPPELRDTIKTFREIWIEGEQLNTIKVEWSVDEGNTWLSNAGQPYAQPIVGGIGARVQIGTNGRQIQFRFTTGGDGKVPTATPKVSYFKVYYDIMSQASGGDY